MASFEEKWAAEPIKPYGDKWKEWLRGYYEAGATQALFEAANRAGDAANEAEKDARRKVAVEEMQSLLAAHGKMQPEKVAEIIQKAQG